LEKVENQVKTTVKKSGHGQGFAPQTLAQKQTLRKFDQRNQKKRGQHRGRGVPW